MRVKIAGESKVWLALAHTCIACNGLTSAASQGGAAVPATDIIDPSMIDETPDIVAVKQETTPSGAPMSFQPSLFIVPRPSNRGVGNQPQPVSAFCMHGLLVGSFPSVKGPARAFGVPHVGITNSVKEDHRTSAGFWWRRTPAGSLYTCAAHSCGCTLRHAPTGGGMPGTGQVSEAEELETEE
jgi:hypothetical protein